jgi:hypothetical protein
MAMTWSSDIQRRKTALAALAKVSGTTPNADGFFAGDGRYVLFHYDLLTISKAGQKLDRSGAYSTIQKTIQAMSGIELGGSVYAVPLTNTEDAINRAVKLWNAVALSTKGQLIEGDAFYLHYSAINLNRLGCVAQVIPAGKTLLTTLKTPVAS